MSKFTIEYTRTVRVRQYETLKIGITEEFDQESTTYFTAYNGIKVMVGIWVEDELKRLRGEKRDEPKSR